MSESTANPPVQSAAATHLLLLNDVFLEPLRKVMNEKVATRDCKVVEDTDFVILCVQRVLQSSKSGRDFLQCHGMPLVPGLNRSNYFKTLKSLDKEVLRCGAAKGVKVLMNYDRQDQKLDERKAWTASETGKRNQALAISLAHNLLRLFSAHLKRQENIEDTKVIEVWRKNLAKRVAEAAEAGRTLPGKLYLALYRPTELSLQFIRWLRITVFSRTSYWDAIDSLRPLMLKYL